MAVRAPTTRSTGRPTPPSPISPHHRGNGRSEDGPRERWNLAQWGDDVHAFCEALGIVNPIVLGASFGGMVALSYATRHPAHPSKLILISTAASGAEQLDRRIELFERFGGPEVGALARRRFRETQGHDQASLDAWGAARHPALFSKAPRPRHGATRRQSARGAVLVHPAGGEGNSFDLSGDLPRIRCQTLVLGGGDDPIHPIESQADIAAALPPHLVQFERFADCGHACMPDAPERTLAVIRKFILS